jgi:transmembrane sensor
MATDNIRLKQLLELYKAGKIEWHDHLELFNLIGNDANDLTLKEYMLDTSNIQESTTDPQKDWDKIYKNISKEISSTDNLPRIHSVHFLKFRWLKHIAVFLLIVGIAAYFLINKNDNHNAPSLTTIEPGTNKAILTLSDGRTIILNDSISENIIDSKALINKTNGVLTYNSSNAQNINSNIYNTMTTPRGGQYQLILPDGSKVWLNSASFIKFPVVFTGNQRIVELQGEAYFDIKANKKMPFLVKTLRADVKVLGTEFNINSYEDEPLNTTTLVKGSVMVSTVNDSKIISPGQQVQLEDSPSKAIKINNDADINQVMAWQKGIFEFNESSLDVIARQISRWYDVKITVGKNNKAIRFSGGITKKTPLETLLRILETNGVNNKWENNIITLYSN